jgi:predicted amidohydrolase YtcJ
MTNRTLVPDLILYGGLITTLDQSRPSASAVAIKEGEFVVVGRDEEVRPLAGAETTVIDLKGRRVLPGLIDNHLHIIRGGLNFGVNRTIVAWRQFPAFKRNTPSVRPASAKTWWANARASSIG